MEKRQEAIFGIRGVWFQFKKHKSAVLALMVIVFFIGVALAAPYVAPYDPHTLGRDAFRQSSRAHLLGTDNLGRDVFSQIMWGARVSLLVGFFSAILSSLVGIVVGGNAGYFGGRLDNFLMRFTDAFMVIPPFFLILLIVSTFGGGIWLVVIMIGATSWPPTARIVRAEFLSLRERDFITAAVAVGVNHFNIIFSHILPNALPAIIVITSLRVAGAIVIEASLSFLGLGDPNVVSWGQMLMSSLEFMRTAWWTATYPGAAIFFVVLALNVVADGLNDALNPKLAHRKT
jgi:peptide/nickel transport system permease protein